jgi:3-methyladenine DNA glycosylase Tag
MMERVKRFRLDPQFAQAVRERQNLIPDFDWPDNEILGRLIALIAYSNNAHADSVTQMVKAGVFEETFHNYSVEKVAALSPENVIAANWSEMTAIRFKRKVDAMLTCAKYLLSIRDRHGSFMRYLRSVGLPSPIKTEADIRAFWEGFGQIRAHLTELDVPYFKNFTSLCHLLMDRGFDCAKPDNAVMKAAVSLGIVPDAPQQKENPEKRRAHPEESLRKTVQTIQRYAVCRDTRAPVIDLYFLIHGGQTGVTGLIREDYYS